MVTPVVKNKFMTSRFERFSYGSFFYAQNLLYVIQFQFLSFYYTEYVGISLGAASTLLLVARLWDAVNDPIMGAIVDKVHFKNSKYLPWLKFVTYVVPLTTVFVFANLGTSSSSKLVFAYITYIIWGMLYTVSDAPLFSLSTVMTDNIYERDQLLAYGRLAAALAAISSAIFLSLKLELGWTITVGIYALIALFFMLPLHFSVKERCHPVRIEHLKLSTIFKSLFKNKYLLIYYIGFLAISTTNTLQVAIAYFASANLHDEGAATIILAISILPIVIIAPFLPKLIQFLGKKKLTLYGSVGFILLSIVMYFVGYDSLPIFLGLSALRTIFMQVPLLIYGMFTADCIEYGHYVTGQRTEGVAFATQTFMTKLGGGLVGALVLQLLSLFGYQEGQSIQSQETLNGIWHIMTTIPIIGFIIMIIIMLFFYHLSEKDVEQMRIENMKTINKQTL